MKKKSRLRRLALVIVFVCGSHWVAQAIESGESIDVTTKVVNPEFDNATLVNGAPSGWVQTTNAGTSKISTAAKGDGSVIKEGENHWQLWNGSALTGKAYQTLTGLPDGKYTLKAGLYTEFAGTIFLYANEGKTSVTSKASAYFEATGTVTDGTLEIGLEIATTGGTTLEFDHVTLHYQANDPGGYADILEEKLAVAIADTASVQRPGYINIQQFRAAIENAKNAAQTAETLLAAIKALDEAIAEFASIKEAYQPLSASIESFTKELNASGYPDKDDLKEEISKARAVYDSPQDQRGNIGAVIAALESNRDILKSYKLLSGDLFNAERLLSSSGYPGKEAFKTAVEIARAISESPSGKDLTGAVSALSEAVIAYLNGRPSDTWFTLKNGALWKDDRGKTVQAHGAGFLQIGDTWYMIGEDRETAKWNPDVNMYSSKDFINWKFEGKIIKNGAHSFKYPDGTTGTLGSNRMIERPKLLYCAKTGQYVIWCHWESGNYGASEAAVFYSDYITGPYKLHWAGRPLNIKSRDCNVFQDDDGKAYFISTTNENRDLGLFELSDDYLSAVKHTPIFTGQGREAPAIVKVNGTYFMISSACTGWDPNQAKISYSKSLTGGWSSNQNIGNGISYDTQAASILTVQGTEGTSYIYVGDRWMDPDLAESKTILFPISFSGNSCTFTYRYQFDLNQVTGKWREAGTTGRIPKAGWKIVSCSSQETSSESGAASNAIDGNPNTKWHTRYSGSAGTAPHYIEVDMGAGYEVSGFLCTPRTDNSTNGLIREFLFEVSADGTSWETVSGGSWMPYYSEIYFTPVTARYFRLTALSGTYASVAELDMLQNTPAYTAQSILPYYKVGSGGWQQSILISNLTAGVNLTFGPNISSGRGTWAFNGPNSHQSATREYTISGLTPDDTGIYTSVFLNSYNQSSKKGYAVSVKNYSSLEEINQEGEEIERKYYTIQGLEIHRPEENQVCIVRKTFRDGSVKVEKTVFKDSY